MENKKASPNYALIAGILFAASIVIMLVVDLRASAFQWRIFIAQISSSMLFAIIAYVVLAYALIKKQRNIISVIGFALLAIGEFLAFISTIRAALMAPYFNTFLLIRGLLCVLSSLFALLVSVVYLTEHLSQYREKTNKLWFVPVLGYVLAHLTRFLGDPIRFWLRRLVSPNFLLLTFELIVFAAGMLFAMLWCAYPDGVPKPTRSVAADGEPTASAAAITDRAYCGLVKHVLLLLFTCGIWHLIWIYRMTDYTNAVNDEEPRNPTTKLLLCMFIPFYVIYWVYKTAQRVDKMAAVKGIASDMATLCLILEIFIPIVPAILLQDKLNKIVTTKEMQPVRESVVKESTTQNVAEELKTFKELLDSGIITQEEFDAKKKELLGL